MRYQKLDSKSQGRTPTARANAKPSILKRQATERVVPGEHTSGTVSNNNSGARIQFKQSPVASLKKSQTVKTTRRLSPSRLGSEERLSLH